MQHVKYGLGQTCRTGPTGTSEPIPTTNNSERVQYCLLQSAEVPGSVVLAKKIIPHPI